MQKPIRLITLSTGLLWLLSGCGGGSDSTTSSTTSYATSGVACSVSSNTNQTLNYTHSAPGGGSTNISTTLPSTYTWSCAGSTRSLVGNGVPNHDVVGGNFATQLSAQNVAKTFTLAPTQKTSTTSAQIVGYAINSVKFDPKTAGTCPSSATNDSTCNYAAGTDPWHMEALTGSVSPWRFSFGADTNNNGHTQPTGEYHYHGMPNDLISRLNANPTTSMTLIGWATDGFPIYARYGYNTATNANSGIKVMTSSYRTKSSPNSGRPSTSNFAMGHFQEDWEYVSGSGDLDECNGRTGVTPEFPNGIYHYYVTDSYPFIQRCVKG